VLSLCTPGTSLVFEGVFVHLTERCNLACRHCYLSSGPAGDYGLDTDLVIALARDTYREMGHVDFTLSGGEPLVRPEDSLRILEAAAPLHSTQLFTNGTLFNADIISRLRRLPTHIRLSVDGGSADRHDELRGRGSFERTMSGIQALLAAGFPASRLSLCATLMPDSLDEVERILELALSLGIERVRFNAFCRKGTGRQLRDVWPRPDPAAPPTRDAFAAFFLDEFRRLYPDWKAMSLDETTLLFSILNIYADGSVYPFIPYDHKRPNPGETPIGNLKVSSLASLLTSEAAARSIMQKFVSYSVGWGKQPRRFSFVHARGV
jgi:MoaA/NifB/PqqE/SkfB family radical SAM enzyme